MLTSVINNSNFFLRICFLNFFLHSFFFSLFISSSQTLGERALTGGQGNSLCQGWSMSDCSGQWGASVSRIHMSWRSKVQTLLITEGQDSFGWRNGGNNCLTAMLRRYRGNSGCGEGQKQNQAAVAANLKETEVARPMTGRANKFSWLKKCNGRKSFNMSTNAATNWAGDNREGWNISGLRQGKWRVLWFLCLNCEVLTNVSKANNSGYVMSWHWKC